MSTLHHMIIVGFVCCICLVVYLFVCVIVFCLFVAFVSFVCLLRFLVDAFVYLLHLVFFFFACVGRVPFVPWVALNCIGNVVSDQISCHNCGNLEKVGLPARPWVHM